MASIQTRLRAVARPVQGIEFESDGVLREAASVIDDLVEALEKISAGETEAWDEGEGRFVQTWMDEDEMQEIARAALTRAQGDKDDG